MGRTALSKIKLGIVIGAVVAGVAAGGAWLYHTNMPAHDVLAASVARNQLTQLSYHGQNGVDALTLLKQHARVETKHYSFGDQVVSIDGVTGSGPKYWTFYINGKEANIGAGAYMTLPSDTLQWRLQ